MAPIVLASADVEITLPVLDELRLFDQVRLVTDPDVALEAIRDPMRALVCDEILGVTHEVLTRASESQPAVPRILVVRGDGVPTRACADHVVRWPLEPGALLEALSVACGV